MKKKLFKNKYLYDVQGLVFLFGCFICLIFYICFVSLVLTKPYEKNTAVDFKIPVVPIQVKDIGFSLEPKISKLKLGKNNLTIIVDKSGSIYYEDCQSVSKGSFYKVESKGNGVIDIDKSKQDIKKWMNYRASINQPVDNKVAVFAPDPTLPLEVVVNLVSDFKKDEVFFNVVMSNSVI